MDIKKLYFCATILLFFFVLVYAQEMADSGQQTADSINDIIYAQSDSIQPPDPLAIENLKLKTGNSDYVDFIHINTIDQKYENLIPLLKSKLSVEIVRFQFCIASFPDIEIAINIAPDKVTYDTWTKNHHVTITDSGAFAELQSNTIFLANQRQSIVDDSVINTLLHEYIHIYIYHHFPDAPLWFQEGMAIYFSRQMSFSYTFQFITNHAFHREYLLLRYAYHYPANRANIEPYYFQAYSIIRKMADDKNVNIANLFEASEKYDSFNDAFYSVFGKTPDDYLSNFKREMDTFFKTNLYIGIMVLTWLLFPTFLIIAKIKQNSKAKELLKQWESES